MMLPRYLTAVARVDRDASVSSAVRAALRLPDRPMIYALSACGLGQADLVLALLSLREPSARAHVARIVGAPIRRYSPAMPPRIPAPVLTSAPRVRLLVSNPRRPNTPAHDRFAATFRDGATVESTTARGATRRDLRNAQRRGWIAIESGRAA